MSKLHIAVIIPCYRVGDRLASVLKHIGPEVERIYVVDDACPEGSGRQAASNAHDARVTLLCNPHNFGVGGAVMAGYRAALHDGMDIMIKLDGDGQMDPRHIPALIRPILRGHADYTKGNRFFSYEHLGGMPALRLFGNAVLSFLSKLSSGYWDIFDPTNGYTAIHRSALRQLPLEKIAEGYFFESDMLFRLNSIRAVVIDVPIKGIYADEQSGLAEHRVFFPFLIGHGRNFCKRILYSYFIRDVSFATLEMLFGACFLLFGALYGGVSWFQATSADVYAPGGVVMLSALSIILGMQLTLSAINYDIQNVPKWPLQMLQDDSDLWTESS